jgi:hypothetical protein
MSQQPFVIVDDPLTTALNNFLKSPLCDGYMKQNGRELTFNKNCDIGWTNLGGPVTCCKNRKEFVKKFNSKLKKIFDSEPVSDETKRSLTLYGFPCNIKLNYRFDDYKGGSLCIEFADFQEFKKNLGITYTPDSLEFYVDLTYDFFSYSGFGELIDFDLEKKVITPKFIGIFTVDELLMIWSTITAIYVISLLQTQDVSMLVGYRIELTQKFKDGINSIAEDYIFVRDMFTFLTFIDCYMRKQINDDYKLEHELEFKEFVKFITTCREEITNRTNAGEDKPSLFRYFSSLLAMSAHKEIFDYDEDIKIDFTQATYNPPDLPDFWKFAWVNYNSPDLPSASIHSSFELQPVHSPRPVVVVGGSDSRRKRRTSKKSRKSHRRRRHHHRRSSRNKKHHTKRHTKRYRKRK